MTFKKNLKATLNNIIKRTVECRKPIEFEDNSEKEIFKINDDALENIKLLHENIVSLFSELCNLKLYISIKCV